MTSSQMTVHDENKDNFSKLSNLLALKCHQSKPFDDEYGHRKRHSQSSPFLIAKNEPNRLVLRVN